MTVELTTADYPLSVNRPDLLRTPTGKALSELTMDAVVSGALTAADVRIAPETLLLQAEIADAARRPPARRELPAGRGDDRDPGRRGALDVQRAAPGRAAPSSWTHWPGGWRASTAPRPAPPWSARPRRSTAAATC